MAANDLEHLAPLLATYLLHSTLWLGGCGALLWLTRVRHPAIRHTAWKWSIIAGFVTALAQFTLPVSSRSLDLRLVETGDRARRVDRGHEPAAAPAPDPAARTMIGPPDVSQAASIDGPAAVEGNTSSIAESFQARGPLTERSPSNRATRDTGDGETASGWLHTAMIVWAVVVGALLARALMAWHRLSHLGDLTELSAGKERELLDRLLAATNTRRQVRLFRSQSGTNPMAWGLWRWQIAVPGTLFERLDRRELRALLAHELAHLARGDTCWLCAWSLLGAIGFLQPLNRIAQRQIRRAAELLSDSWAVEATGDRLSLARALTKTAELRGGLALPLASLAVASSSALAERVDRLVGSDRSSDGSRRGRWLTVIVGSTAITAAVVWLPGVRLTTAGQFIDGPPPRSDAPPSLDDPIRALDRELNDLDRELGELRSFVVGALASDARQQDVAESWRAITRRRGRVREGHVRVTRLLEQVTAATKSSAGNP